MPLVDNMQLPSVFQLLLVAGVPAASLRPVAHALLERNFDEAGSAMAPGDSCFTETGVAWSDPNETAILEPERMAHCGDQNCDWDKAQKPAKRKSDDLNDLIDFMMLRAPKISLEADLVAYKCAILSKFEYELKWFNVGDQPSGTIASVTPGSGSAEFNTGERWRTLGAFYAVFFFTRLYTAAERQVNELLTQWKVAKDFPVTGVKSMMKSVIGEDPHNGGLRDLLLLTAVHDIFKARGASDTPESRWIPQPATLENPPDHDEQLAFVLTNAEAVSRVSSHPFGTTDNIVTSQQMDLNFGWLVQFEGPPKVVLEKFVDVIKEKPKEEQNALMQFYFAHYYTDLAGGAQERDKGPSYKLHFLVNMWMRAGEQLMDLVNAGRSASDVYIGLLKFLLPIKGNMSVGERRLILWSQLQNETEQIQLLREVRNLNKTIPELQELLDRLARTGYTIGDGGEMTPGAMPLVKYVPQWWRKVAGSKAALKPYMGDMVKFLNVVLRTAMTHDAEKVYQLPDPTRADSPYKDNDAALHFIQCSDGADALGLEKPREKT